MDDIDISAERWELLRVVYVQNELDRIHKIERERVVFVPMCEHCEEFKAYKSPQGVYSKYCQRCAEELQLIAGK
jgi:hypothetical protein